MLTRNRICGVAVPRDEFIGRKDDAFALFAPSPPPLEHGLLHAGRR